MTAKFKTFVEKIRQEMEKDTICVYEFGSHRGEENPKISDIDLFIIAKKNIKTAQIVATIRRIEKATLHTTHSEVTDLIEEAIFASGDYTGIHAIVISEEELDNNYIPQSLRLRLITNLLISQNILYYHLKHEARLLFGKDIITHLNYKELSFHDRLTCLITPLIILLFIPFICKSTTEFKIWCFKTIRYHADLLCTYLKVSTGILNLTNSKLKLNQKLIEESIKYRYNPKDYKANLFWLYCSIWLFFIGNLSFLWNPTSFLKSRGYE